MSRSKWKGPFLNKLRTDKTKLLSENPIKIWHRNVTVPYSLIGKSAFVHSGKEFIKIYISRERVGLKFGEFVYTKNYNKDKKDSKTKK